MSRSIVVIVTLVVILTIAFLPQDGGETRPVANGNLIPATTTMVTAWDIPKDPLTDSSLISSPNAEEIRWGFRLFTNTHEETPHFSPNKLSCNHCHLNGGQREKAMPLVGVAGVFPEYNKRAGRQFSLEDRIVGCFMRSQNAAERESMRMTNMAAGGEEEGFPSTVSKEVRALAAYITWISEEYPAGAELPWRGQNSIHANNVIPLDKLDPKRGEALFIEKCSSCHGEDGQGQPIGDKKPGPLWGPHSWNDGAGAARIYTLAGIIRYAMPYLDPGSLTDEEAQQISAFINSKPRPKYPFKAEDYRTEPLPPDAVYYLQK